MTWHAQRGKTVLAGEEAEMFRVAVVEMAYNIQYAADDQHAMVDNGPRLYNRVTRSQKAASLLAVCQALFRETDVCLPLTAWSEATLAAILAQIRLHLICEIDLSESSDTRDFLVKKDWVEITRGGKDWNSMEEWLFNFEIYGDEFLWDDDFSDDQLMDLAPETSRMIGEKMGIDEDYHTAIPPDLIRDDDLNDCIEKIDALVKLRKR